MKKEIYILVNGIPTAVTGESQARAAAIGVLRFCWFGLLQAKENLRVVWEFYPLRPATGPAILHPSLHLVRLAIGHSSA